MSSGCKTSCENCKWAVHKWNNSLSFYIPHTKTTTGLFGRKGIDIVGFEEMPKMTCEKIDCSAVPEWVPVEPAHYCRLFEAAEPRELQRRRDRRRESTRLEKAAEKAFNKATGGGE